MEEHLHHRGEGVEQRWAFAQEPPGEGDVVVRLPLLSGRLLAETSSGLHFHAGPEGSPGVRYGHGVWVDAEGRRTPVPARFEEGGVVLRVPHATLEASAWPAVLDPLLTPELRVDEPVLGPAQGTQGRPAVAWSDTQALVVWEDTREGGPSEVYGTRVDSGGRVLDPAGIRLSRSTEGSYRPQVASDGTDFVVVWEERPSTRWHVRSTRVSADGVVLDDGRQLGSSDFEEPLPTVAWGGGRYLIAWSSRTPTVEYELWAARMSQDGELLEPAGFLVASASVPMRSPSAAWSGSHFLLAWADVVAGNGFDIRGVLLPADGPADTPVPLVISGASSDQLEPEVVACASGYFVAWKDHRLGRSAIFGARVGTSGALLDAEGLRLSVGENSADWPRAVWTGGEVFVAWGESAFEGRSLEAVRVSAQGEVREGTRRQLLAARSSQTPPALAWGAGQALLVWQTSMGVSSSDLVSLRLDATGQPLEDSPSLLSTSAQLEVEPRVAWGGGHYLVVWRDLRAHGGGDIYAARLLADGTLVDPTGIALARGTGSREAPAVASNGSGFLVAWRSVREGRSRIEAVRLSAAGVRLDEAPLQLSSGELLVSPPAVASNGRDFLVTWVEQPMKVNASVALARVPSSGGLEAGGPWLHHRRTSFAHEVAVASDGQGYLLALASYATYSDRDVFTLRADELDGGFSLTDFTSHGGIGTARDLPVLVAGGGGFLLVWRNDHIAAYALLARSLGPRGEALGTAAVPLPLSPKEVRSLRAAPGVAWTGERHLVVWTDWSNSWAPVARAVRLEPSGALVDAQGFALTAPGGLQGVPAVASSGTSSLVVYTGFDDGTDALGWRVLGRLVKDGTVPRVSSLTLSTEEDTPVSFSPTVEDDDCKAFTFRLRQGPTRGTLQGSWPHLTYVPRADEHGQDSLRFQVLDCTGEPSEEATLSVTIHSVNDVPHASTETLRLSGSSPRLPLSAGDADGDALTYQVTQAPSVGTLRTVQGGLAYDVPADFRGLVTFRYRVSDGQATSPEATVTLVVRNAPPSVWLRSMPRQVEGTEVAFGASVSDGDGDALHYAWDFGDGATSREPAPRHTYANEGTYRVALTVSDGFESQQSVRHVQVGNVAPSIQRLETPQGSEEGRPVTLRVRASDPGVRDILSYAWDFADGGPVQEGGEVTHSFPDSGRYRVKVTVTDDAGASVERELEVEVTNLPPVVEEVPSIQVRAGESVRLTLKASDPGGEADPLVFRPRAGPGRLDAQGTWTWTPPRTVVGHHAVRFSVTDDEGATTEAAFIVSVAPFLSAAGMGLGCAATGSSGAGLAPGLLLLLWQVWRRRRRPSGGAGAPQAVAMRR